eukprot:9011744-Lingulodinium_polyedra.AAC.1
MHEPTRNLAPQTNTSKRADPRARCRARAGTRKTNNGPTNGPAREGTRGTAQTHAPVDLGTVPDRTPENAIVVE